jgi:hypothetical protein
VRCALQESQISFWSTLYVFAVFFAGFWCIVCVIISFLSGWYALSTRFRAQTEPYGETKTAGPIFYGVQMRFKVSYGNAVRIITAQDALYLSILFLFRIGHPPLRIPWDEIQFARAKFWWLRYVVLTLGNEEKIPMRLSERMARKLGILERLPETGRLTSGLHFDTLSDSFVASQTKKPD